MLTYFLSYIFLFYVRFLVFFLTYKCLFKSYLFKKLYYFYILLHTIILNVYITIKSKKVLKSGSWGWVAGGGGGLSVAGHCGLVVVIGCYSGKSSIPIIGLVLGWSWWCSWVI
jgi:hypothetical protein